MSKKKAPAAPKLKADLPAMSLRPTVQEHKDIDKLKTIYNIKPSATVIMKAVQDVPLLKDEIIALRKRIILLTEMVNSSTHAFVLIKEGFELMGLTGNSKKAIPLKKIPVDKDDEEDDYENNVHDDDF